MRDEVSEVMVGCVAFNSCEFPVVMLDLLLLGSRGENVNQGKVAEDK